MKNRWKRGCLLGAFLSMLFCSWLILLWLQNIGYCDGDIDRSRLDIAAKAFTWTLMENCVDAAKSIASEEKWEWIDVWGQTDHSVSDCSALAHIFNGTDEWSYSIGSVAITTPDGKMSEVRSFFGDETTGSYPIDTIATMGFYSLWWPCPASGDYVYVHDFKFRWTESGWQVEDWGEITGYFIRDTRSSK